MQNFEETEIDHHDLTNQESELQEKNTPNESVKLVSRPISVLNKEELNQHRENGKNTAINNGIILFLSLRFHVECGIEV